jgi:hypothetical protein
MPFCPSCGAEFRAGFTTCNTCRVPLVDSLDGGDEPEDSSAVSPRGAAYADEGEDTLRLLGTYEEDAPAHYVRRLLDDAGIPSVLVGGHGASVRACEPYRVLVDEDYVEAAEETIESFRSPSLVTGQIEGNLTRLTSELNRIERAHDFARPQVLAVRASLEKLQSDLNALNRELSEE